MKVSVFLLLVASLFVVATAERPRGSSWDKAAVINFCKQYETSPCYVELGYIDGVKVADLNDKDLGELFDIAIKGLKAEIAIRPDAAEWTQKHIDRFEREKTKLA